MAFQVNNQAIVAFKHLLGKSNTDVAKGVNNEFEEIGLTVTGANVWTDMISATPATAVSANVAVAVSCDVVLDATSNGHALFAVWPVTPPTGTDPKTGLAFTYGTGSLVDVVAGDRVRRAIPDSFGTGYLARPFYMGNAIPVGDQRDWIYQYNSGIFFQEDGSNESWGGSSYAHPDQIDLYVYIGKTVQDITAGSGSEWYASVSSIDCTPPVTPTIGDRYLICPGPSPSAIGAWIGQEDTIAEYSGIGWIFTEPTQGGTVQIDDQPGVYYLYTGSDYPGGSWIQVPSTIVRIGVATGTDTYLATVDPPITAYSNFVFIGVFDNANTGPSTINVNGLGDVIVRKNSNGSLVDLDALDIRSGVMYMLVYDGTIFQLYTGDLGDFVPISGTDIGNPVNGDIEVAPGVKIYTTGSPSNPSIVFNLGHIEVEGSVMKYDINRHIDFDARTLVDKEYVDDRIIKHTLAVDRTITAGDMYTVWGNFTLDTGQTIDNDGRLVIINGTFIDNGTYNQGANGSLEIVSTNLDYILGIDNKVNGQDILWTDGTGNWVTGQSTTYFGTAADNVFVTKEYVLDSIGLHDLQAVINAGSTATLGSQMYLQAGSNNAYITQGLLGSTSIFGIAIFGGISPVSGVLTATGYYTTGGDFAGTAIRGVDSDNIDDISSEIYWGDSSLGNSSARLVLDGTIPEAKFDLYAYNNVAYKRIVGNTAASGIVVTDGINSVGMVYAADYSANYTNRSLVDKEYVDNAVSAGAPTKFKGTFVPGTLGAANIINHGLNTLDVMVQIWYNSKMISANIIEVIDANNVDIRFAGSNPSGEVSPDVVDVRIIGL